MTLGIALLLIFILYLIDKHALWKYAPRLAKKVLIVCGVLALGTGIVWGMIVGWSAYSDYRDTKKSKAEAEKFHAKVKACEERPFPAGATTVDCSNPDNPIYPAPAIWIYVDVSQEYGGHIVPQPTVPGSIDSMVKNQKGCPLDSIACDGKDHVEWVCVEPTTKPNWIAADGIMTPLTAASAKTRSVWIYVDDFEQFNGHLDTSPEVPIQIVKMVNRKTDCVPGSKTWGRDSVEWICIEPAEFIPGLPPNAILVPTLKSKSNATSENQP